MFKVGLTGGIGSGKSTVASFFSELGITVISLDEISRMVVAKGEPALAEITEHFGPIVSGDDGNLDRKALRRIIFGDEQARLWLESLLHPLIRKKQNQILDAAPGDYAMIEIPLLAENQLQKTVDRVLVVDLPESIQLERASKRDKADKSAVEAILNSQANREDRLSIADDVIENDGSIEDLKSQVEMLHQNYLKLAQVSAIQEAN